MSINTAVASRIPAGWYPDPLETAGRRWWNGERWTEHTAALQAPEDLSAVDKEIEITASGPVLASALAAWSMSHLSTGEVERVSAGVVEEIAVSAANTAAAAAALATGLPKGKKAPRAAKVEKAPKVRKSSKASTPVLQTQTPFAVAPAVAPASQPRLIESHAPAAVAKVAPIEPFIDYAKPATPSATLAPAESYVPFGLGSMTPTSSVNTQVTFKSRGVWWLAASPIWLLAAVVALGQLAGGLQSMYGALASAGAAILGTIIIFALAIRDRRVLRTADYPAVPSFWWMLLGTLAYLIARAVATRNVDVSGWSLVVSYLVASVLAPVIAVVGLFAVLGALPF